MEFKKFNKNPKNKKVGDCVVRALACATNDSWVNIYSLLVKKGLEEYGMPNDRTTYHKVLEDLGWKKQPMPKKTNNKKYRLREWVDLNKDINMIIALPKHLTYAEKGTLIDTWDCSIRYVNNYWIK